MTISNMLHLPLAGQGPSQLGVAAAGIKELYECRDRDRIEPGGGLNVGLVSPPTAEAREAASRLLLRAVALRLQLTRPTWQAPWSQPHLRLDRLWSAPAKRVV